MKEKKATGKKLIIVISAVAALIIILMMPSKDTQVTKLKRPGYGEDRLTYKLRVQSQGDSFDMDIPVNAVKISEDMLQSAFSEAYEAVCKALPGKNNSLDEVMYDLEFTKSYDKYGMNISYEMNNYDIIDCDGVVNSEKVSGSGEDLMIYVRIEYDELSQSYEIPVHVMPPEYSDKELLEQKILEGIDRNSDDTDEYAALPNQIDGKDITYVSKGQGKGIFILLLALTAFTLWYYKKFVIPKNLNDRRESQMKSDYSEIVSKLSLLMGAGMSGANALARITSDYRSKVKEKTSKDSRYAYEEIATASGQIASGVSEPQVYADLGRRCRIHCYVKLAGLMAQNVRKGGDGFTAMLRAETTEAFEERKAIARQRGEKAGTKLLLPMIMMLAVVLVMIMVPAFMSF